MSPTKIPLDLILEKMAEDAEKAQQRVSKASEVLQGQLNTDLATTPYEIVYEEDRVKLKHYIRNENADNKLKTPLLVVYALINRETMLDLQPDRSVVKTFLEGGIDLYMVDWGYPKRKDHFLTIDDHVNGYMNNMVDFIRRKHKVPKINLMGICMGGSFSIMYSALHPDKIKNLVTTVTPSSFDTDKGLLHIWMRDLDVDGIINTYGNIPGDLMNFGFLLLNPARLMIDKYVGFMENMDNKDFVENFVRMERWIFDSPDVPGATFRQFVEDCYKRNLLIQSRMVLGGQRVDLKNLTMPLLNFYGQYDHLVPPEACNQLTKAVGSRDVEDICLETGHIGIYVSSKFQKMFAPKIVHWLRERDSDDILAVPGKTSESAVRKRKPMIKKKVAKTGEKNLSAKKLD
ncbi:MAG TPA: class III poly(R)-hydroxyalkanoic acid synthase subunit PhaC [Smithella sp.]|nr:class III poly(R)-hydroxyalkanoic acid synthase subunit PhaC [Smithella sp.]MDM7985946.1 class III poly(R)-hydroxyalkanoic acid synthase subunit PhaC [Smithella sp.]HNY51054.1 class III poly(R)-hydroxyalkanoic acid synthase subunit PhaC [Smithella sp.]HOG91184.1 class III poly(R)-hydroxyalkanoic acid synthase subunit PhaC [Smithella sp.]HOU51579.1 class III poly(R)-hydroxyalkanoic acid synthase subunit PhaC [Smithella sp.]